MADFQRQRGTPLEPLPFPGAIYNLATGENYTTLSLRTWRSRRMKLEKLLHTRPLTRAIREEFGLYPVAPSVNQA